MVALVGVRIRPGFAIVSVIAIIGVPVSVRAVVHHMRRIHVMSCARSGMEASRHESHNGHEEDETTH